MNSTCKVCNQPKLKLLDKIYKDGTYRYVNQFGKLWEGRACPECVPVVRRKRREKKNGRPSRSYNKKTNNSK